VWVPIVRGTPDGWNLFDGLSTMAMAPDAHHVFAGLTPANSAYYKDEVEQEMINEYGQGHQQDM
jgi:hypothetical protein